MNDCSSTTMYNIYKAFQEFHKVKEAGAPLLEKKERGNFASGLLLYPRVGVYSRVVEKCVSMIISVPPLRRISRSSENRACSTRQ